MTSIRKKTPARLLAALPAAALLLAGSLLPPQATAADEGTAATAPAKDRFALMDTDGNGVASKEEFLKAFPNMKDAAYDAMDTNRDGALTREEWGTFMEGHGAMKAPIGMGGMGGGMGGAMGACPAREGSTAMPMVMPPSAGSQGGQ